MTVTKENGRQRSSAEVFADATIEQTRSGLGPPEELILAIRASSRKALNRPHPVKLESFGGVTIYVGAEGFAWWLFQWDAARVAAGVREELLAVKDNESLASESAEMVVPKMGKSSSRRWLQWWRR